MCAPRNVPHIFEIIFSHVHVFSASKDITYNSPVCTAQIASNNLILHGRIDTMHRCALYYIPGYKVTSHIKTL